MCVLFVPVQSLILLKKALNKCLNNASTKYYLECEWKVIFLQIYQRKHVIRCDIMGGLRAPAKVKE